MWISSSSIKNRVSDRGRIDIFSRGSISGWKASLLLLALASFFVSAASDCVGPKDGTCFAKNPGELEDGQSDYIDIDKDGKITWNATDGSKKAPLIELYTLKCGKLSFIMSDLAGLEDKCGFSMLYYDCTMDIEWKKTKMGSSLGFSSGSGEVVVRLNSEVKVDLDGAKLECKSGSNDTQSGFCPFKLNKDGDWCKFDFAFNKTGSCDGKIQLGTDYKLLATPAPTTVAPETTPTTGADAAGLSPWIIAGIVVAVLLLVAVVVGLLVFFLIRRRNRLKSQNAGPKILTGARTFYVPATKKRDESPTYHDDQIKTQNTNTTERLEIEMGLPVEKDRQNKNIHD